MKYIFIFLCIFALLNCKIEDNDEITIEVPQGVEHIYIGSQEGKFGLAANTKDQNDFFNSADIEEKTHFDFNITSKENNANTYPLTCRLWKDEQKELTVLCQITTELKQGDEFSIEDTINFEYNTKNVTIVFNVQYLEFHQVEGKLPFLYSSKKDITITNQKTINLEFKIDSYNEEPLFISKDYTFVHLENCKKGQSNILKCELPRENLDIIANKENSYNVYYINENLGYDYFPFVKPINIKYQNNKEDIHFKLVKLVNNKIEIGSYITFETNIINMDKIKTTSFDLNLPEKIVLDCHFIKHDKSTPLYMSCYYGYTRPNYTIEQIEGFNQNNLHHKYNFIFETQNFTETIYTIDSGSYMNYIKNAYPESLDFTEKDSYKIYIDTELDNITLNENGEYLDCEKGYNFRKCTVPKSYFKEEKNKYYLFQHQVNEGNNTINYEAFGVKVIFEKENPVNSGKIIKYSFGLFALICFLVL